MSATRPPLDEIVETLAGGRPDLPPQDQRLAVTLYRRLATGHPVAVGDLAIELGRPPTDIEERLDEWHGVERDDDGRVTGFAGLTLSPTVNRLTVGDVELYAWCPWDPMFIVPILQVPGALYTRCAVTDQPIRLDLRAHGVAASSHPAPMLSFLVPDEDREADVRTAFCQHVRMFADRTAALRWAADHRPPVFLLDLDEAFEIAYRDLVGRYGDALAGG